MVVFNYIIIHIQTPLYFKDNEDDRHHPDR